MKKGDHFLIEDLFLYFTYVTCVRSEPAVVPCALCLSGKMQNRKVDFVLETYMHYI